MPNTIGTSVTYVSEVSFCRMMNRLKSAVKNGVVAPIAWLKLTGMNLNEMFPPTTDATNTTARTATFARCLLDFRFCLGTNPDARTANDSAAHISMWHMVRKMGYLNPQTLRRYLLSKITPMLEKYHAAITLSVYALIEDATARARARRVRAGEGTARQRRGQRLPRAPRARPRAPEEGGRAERRCPLCRRGRVPRGGCLRGATVPRSLARERTSRVAREGNRAGSPRERRRRVSRRRERAWARTVYVVEIAFRDRRRPRRATVRGPPRRARVLGLTTPRRDPRATDRVRTASPGLTRPAPG